MLNIGRRVEQGPPPPKPVFHENHGVIEAVRDPDDGKAFLKTLKDLFEVLAFALPHRIVGIRWNPGQSAGMHIIEPG
jgi:hypothetical protein